MNARLAVLEYEAEFEPEEAPRAPERPALVWDQSAAARQEEADALSWRAPAPRIIEAVPTPSSRPRVRRKRFAEATAGAARTAAGEWLRDFTRHGPLEILRIATQPCQAKFLTTVIYTRG
jgi:hypothetical protein